MSSFKSDDISIGITLPFMKFIGFWMATNRFELCLRYIAQTYTWFTILYSVWVQTRGFYYSWGDFSASLYTGCNILSVAMPVLKIVVLLLHKKDFFYLILYTEREFLRGEYDEHETTILKYCKRQCTFFVGFFITCTMGTLAFYVISPLMASIGKNESERVLPFNMWLDLPLTTTPYYELVFLSHAMTTYQIGVIYFCFDNFLCIMNLHLAGQFRILQYRFAKLSGLGEKHEGNEKENLAEDSISFASKCYVMFKKHVQQHQALIAYCDKLEEVFSSIVLGQVLMLSIIVCLDGYQALMPNAPLTKRLIFAFHLSACLCQLLMFTYSCDCIIRESMGVASAVYRGPWTLLPLTTSGKTVRKDSIFVIMRSGAPCCLTARKFFVVSLETYTSVLSTAVSYFTLLKQTEEDANV